MQLSFKITRFYWKIYVCSSFGVCLQVTITIMGNVGGFMKRNISSSFFFSIMHWEKSFLLTSLANNTIHVEILKSYWKNEGKNSHSTFHCFSFKNVINELVICQWQHLQFVFCITWLMAQKVKTSNAVSERQTRSAVGMQIIHWH